MTLLNLAQLQGNIIASEHAEFILLRLSFPMKRKVDLLVKKLKDLNKLCKMLKCADAAINIFMDFFGTVPEDHNRLSDRVDADARTAQHSFS